jgi:hypothetical protein
MMTVARVAGENFDLDLAGVQRAVAVIDPEPIREHYVVIGRRRYPPKQVLAAVTGLDRGDCIDALHRALDCAERPRGALRGGLAVRRGALAAQERAARAGLAGSGDAGRGRLDAFDTSS